tara:strand:- start:12163 stop:12939 length:777 start_codon:yes stop_codon:yes gene_type:complete
LKIDFFKYQGSGNDFIIIDNRENKLSIDSSLIQNLCHRKFGIGGDGLITLHGNKDTGFSIKHYNSDGKKSSFCANGSRCMVHFAKYLNLFIDKFIFSSNGKNIVGSISEDLINITMPDVINIKTDQNGYYILNTGCLHLVVFSEDLENVDVKYLGSEIRNMKEYYKDGINVNFVEEISDKISIRTYERGVENETLSCGTGVVASALALNETSSSISLPVKVKTLGGELSVSWKKNNNKYQDIILSGPVSLVFQGELIL